MNYPMYTIITGNPIDGFECYGVFDFEYQAIEWANNDAHLPDSWHVMKINDEDEDEGEDIAGQRASP